MSGTTPTSLSSSIREFKEPSPTHIDPHHEDIHFGESSIRSSQSSESWYSPITNFAKKVFYGIWDFLAKWIPFIPKRSIDRDQRVPSLLHESPFLVLPHEESSEMIDNSLFNASEAAVENRNAQLLANLPPAPAIRQSTCTFEFLRPAPESPARIMWKSNIQVLEKLLLNDQLILKFVSHPDTHRHFHEAKKKLQDHELSLRDKINKLKQDFPNDQQQLAQVERRLGLVGKPIPYEGIFIPFLVYGLADTSSVSDPVTVGQVQAFQVRIFRNWLARFHIGSQDTNLLKDIKEFSANSSLELFSKIIDPLLAKAEELDEDYNDIVRTNANDNKEEYDLPFDVSFDLSESFRRDTQQIVQNLQSKHNEDWDSDDESPVAQAIEKAFGDENDLLVDKIFKDYFYFDAILNLFIKVNNLEQDKEAALQASVNIRDLVKKSKEKA